MAHAQDAAAAFERYRMGDYEGAIAAGEATRTGEGLTVAARAAFAEANLRDMPCLPCLKRVEELSRRAIMLDPRHPDAFVYLAAALGYEARIIGYVRATLEKYPEQAKDAVDRALAVAPNDAFSLAALGGWHFEIVRNAGSLMARTLFGARIDAGEEAFRRAIAADPGNLVVRLQYVLAASAYDLNRFRRQVAEQLAAIATTEPRTAYETVMKQRAARLQELLNANQTKDYVALISRYQGYPAA
jgi:tetratricopeptide (TPR) repeat protein